MMRVREDREEKDIYHQTILINLNNYCYQGEDIVRRDVALFDQDGTLYTNTLVIVDIYLPNIRKKCYTKGIEALNEMERFLLIGIEQDIKSALEYVGEDIVMKEFMRESESRSYDDDLRQSYDKEEALKDQSFRDGKWEKSVEFVRRLLEERANISLIEKTTLLSREEIEEIAKEENLKIYDDLRESYDKEEALKDQSFRDGKWEKSVEIVRRLLEERANISLIEKATLLSREEIEEIAKEENLKIYDDLRESYDKEEALKDQAFQEGKDETRLNFARRMLEENMDISLISKITSLKESEIEKLKKA